MCPWPGRQRVEGRCWFWGAPWSIGSGAAATEAEGEEQRDERDKVERGGGEPHPAEHVHGARGDGGGHREDEERLQAEQRHHLAGGDRGEIVRR